MATIKAVILASKTIKGGKNKVRISIAHNGETRYIVTDIILDSNKEFKNGQVVKRPDASMLNTKIRSLLQRYQAAIDEIEYKNGISCPELVNLVETGGAHKHPTLEQMFKEYISSGNISARSIEMYSGVWINIERAFGNNILVEHINRGVIANFEKTLRNRNLSSSTIRLNLTFMRALVNFAIKSGYVSFRVHPFANYSLPYQEVRQSWLTVEQIRQIRDFKHKSIPATRARDFFMLSYYLGGINMADMLKINFNEQADTICYIRQKTANKQKVNKYVEFDIPEEAKEIINRRKGADGYIAVTKSQRENRCHQMISDGLKIIEAELGIKNLIYYSARKSFAQHAFGLQISTSVIDFILGHSLGIAKSAIYPYIFVSPEMATNAVRKVLDNLK